MCFTGRKDDRASSSQPNLFLSIVKESFSFDDVIDLIRLRVRMDD
jgi:hypothetical protein